MESNGSFNDLAKLKGEQFGNTYTLKSVTFIIIKHCNMGVLIIITKNKK
jgi:hypothetical protein